MTVTYIRKKNVKRYWANIPMVNNGKMVVYVDQTLTESKGSLTLDIDGNLVYTPNGSWRGADIFELRVVTSSTRFNENKKYLVLSANMVQEQSNAMDSKSVQTSGGAFGLLNLLALLGLIGLRHYKK